MPLLVTYTASGAALHDDDGHLRGVVIEERFGEQVIYSWRHLANSPDALTMEWVSRGSEKSMVEAVEAIKRCVAAI